MIKSMTGYGRAEAIINEKKVVIEIKSLNHRFLEIVHQAAGVLFPPGARGKKEGFRSVLQGADRGQHPQGFGPKPCRRKPLELNMPVIRNYYGNDFLSQGGTWLKEEISLGLLLAMKDAITVSEPVSTSARSGKSCSRPGSAPWTAWKA